MRTSIHTESGNSRDSLLAWSLLHFVSLAAFSRTPDDRRFVSGVPSESQNSSPTLVAHAAFYLSPTPPAIWHDQCFTSTRRGRSLIKLLKDFRRRPKRGLALRFVDSERELFRFHRAFSVFASTILSFFPSHPALSRYSIRERERERGTTFSVSSFPPRARLSLSLMARESQRDGARIAFREIESTVSNPPGAFPAIRSG